MQQLIDSKDNGLIKIVTGLRRVGKSYLLKILFKEYLLKEGVNKDHILIIDLEDMKKKDFRNPDYLLDWVDAQMTDEGQIYMLRVPILIFCQATSLRSSVACQHVQERETFE